MRRLPRASSLGGVYRPDHGQKELPILSTDDEVIVSGPLVLPGKTQLANR